MNRRRGFRLLLLVAVLAATTGCGGDRPGTPAIQPVWKKDPGNPVLFRGLAGSWDAFEVATPCVLEAGDGAFVMWYTGRGAARSRIGLATSSDGVTWVKYAGSPVLGPGPTGTWDALDVADPCVLHDGAGYRMYYAGQGVGSGGIGLATSTDGFHWSRSESNPVLTPNPAGTSWDDKDVYTPWVLNDRAGYKMWYGATDAIFRAIGHATSVDGISWTKLFRPVLDPMPLEAITFAPCVVETHALYQIWYGARHETPPGGVFPAVIDHAQSLDGIDWTSNRTVLSPGDSGAWDAVGLKSACVLQVAGRLDMWYEGRAYSAGDSTQGFSSIGLATYP